MHPLKSPGSDGFSTLFYQQYSDLVGRDACKLLLNILNDGMDPTDKNFLFAWATNEEAKKFLSIISKYKSASGQRINYDKSEISFSQNVPFQIKHMIKEMIGVKILSSHDRYLGLLTIVGKSTG